MSGDSDDLNFDEDEAAQGNVRALGTAGRRAR
jgi:hypothetical protein